IPAGAKVRFMYASANRDETHFTDAAEFRIDRDPLETRRHLTFGHGNHACIGSSLARAELRAGLKSLLSRLPGIHLHPSRPPERNPSFFVNGFFVLPVAWDPAAVRPAAERQAAAATPS
ncbi:MAG: cytochrome P450, partial [bacterium]